jgi:hypothetical protein
MASKLIPNNPIVEYPDYKNLISFLGDSYKLKIKNINPYEYFRLENSEEAEKFNKKEYVEKFFKGTYNSLPTFKDLEDEFQRHQNF